MSTKSTVAGNHMAIARSVKDIITRKLVSLDENDSIYDAVTLMSADNIGAIVATSNGLPVGIVTERDLMKKVTLRGLDAKNVKIGDIMSQPLITIGPDASLGEAALLMHEKNIRRILVKKESKVLGIITQRDLQRATLEYFSALATLS